MKGRVAGKNRFLAFFLVLCLVIGSVAAAGPFPVAAATEFSQDELIIVNGKTVYKDDTMAEVEARFGQPQLVTPSPFGGSAYTFYHGDYQDYLYLETDGNGRIAAYGSVGPGFQTAVVDYGETYRDYYVRSYTVATDRDNCAYGFVGYTGYASSIGASRYHERLLEQSDQYNTALCRHSVLMFNAVSALYGYNTPMVFQEESYQRTLQLAENGSNVYKYATAVGKDGYVFLMGFGSYNWPNITYINPLYFAEQGQRYRVPSGQNQAQFIFYLQQGKEYCFYGSVDPQLYQAVSVPLTAEEQEMVDYMTQQYQKSVDLYNSVDSYYTEEPSFDALPISSGEIQENVLESALVYLNLIRYGGGLPALTLDDELCQGAQAKAAYTVYLSSHGISNPSPHYPPKVEGISDEFYALCQAGSGENLYQGEAITSITRALDDGSGDPVYCGHRYNLLNPSYTKIGLGSSSASSFSSQGVHKFSGQQDSQVEAVCWPSAGVTPVEAIYVERFQWTAQLYRYSVTTDTDVTVTCLNTGESWQFSRDNGNLSRSGNFLSWSDDNLSVSAGNVYTVTIGSVKDSLTGQITDYTYRAVIANLYQGAGEEMTDLQLDQTSYSGAPGEVVKFHAIITPNGVDNALVNWSSSDESVATVTQNGIVTLKSQGTAVITAVAGNGRFMAQAEVVVSSSTPPPTPEKDPYDINQDGAVDVLDAMALARMVVNQNLTVDLEQVDFDGNHKLDVLDVMWLVQHIS